MVLERRTHIQIEVSISLLTAADLMQEVRAEGVQILLIDSEGLQKPGLLLAASPDWMRVMLPGMTDVIEFRRIGGMWMAESGPVVEIAGAAPVATHEPGIEEPACRQWRLTV